MGRAHVCVVGLRYDVVVGSPYDGHLEIIMATDEEWKRRVMHEKFRFCPECGKSLTFLPPKRRLFDE